MIITTDIVLGYLLFITVYLGAMALYAYVCMYTYSCESVLKGQITIIGPVKEHLIISLLERMLLHEK